MSTTTGHGQMAQDSNTVAGRQVNPMMPTRDTLPSISRHLVGGMMYMAHSMQNPTTHFCRGLPRIWQKIVAKMFWKPLKLDTLSKKLLRKHTL